MDDELKAPERGQCTACGFAGPGKKYCRRSLFNVGTPQALRFCVPAPLGDPYIPVVMRTT